MKPPVILIIKTGSTYSDLRNALGDFDIWIKNAAGDFNCNWKVKPVADVEPDKIPNYQGVIITVILRLLSFTRFTVEWNVWSNK